MEIGMCTSTSHVSGTSLFLPLHLEACSLPILVMLRWGSDIVPVKPSRKLESVLLNIINRARDLCPGYTLHPLGFHSDASSSSSAGVTNNRASRLRISLTHPHPLRRDQLDSFRGSISRAIRVPLTPLAPLRLSFAGELSAYVNGKKYGGEGAGGRAFLAVRLAAGQKQVSVMATGASHGEDLGNCVYDGLSWTFCPWYVCRC